MSDAPRKHSFFPRPSNTSMVASFIAIIGCFLAMGLIVYLAYLPNRVGPVTVDMSLVPADQQWKYSADGRKEHLIQMHANETDMLNHYVWVDQSAGIVRVPIDRAMELIVNEQRAEKR